MSTNRDPIEEQKEVAFYGAMVEAWVATRMEKDRTVLALSVGGVGLLVTLLTTMGPSSRCELMLYGLGVLFYLGATLCGIWIFGRNAAHLRDVIKRNAKGDDPDLVRLDTIFMTLFLIGVGFTILVGASAGLTSLRRASEHTSKGGNAMAEKQAIQMPESTRSLSGAGDLRPGNAAGGGTGASGSAGAGAGTAGQQSDGKKGS